MSSMGVMDEWVSTCKQLCFALSTDDGICALYVLAPPTTLGAPPPSAGVLSLRTARLHASPAQRSRIII